MMLRVREEKTIRHIKQFANRFVHDEQGQDLVAYALIVAAVGLALVATVNQLSTAVVSLYQSITTGLGSIGTGRECHGLRRRSAHGRPQGMSRSSTAQP